MAHQINPFKPWLVTVQIKQTRYDIQYELEALVDRFCKLQLTGIFVNVSEQITNDSIMNEAQLQ